MLRRDGIQRVACSTTRSGLTIVELLVAVGILGLLMAILVPAVQQVRNTSRLTQCKNNLRQIGLALANCVDRDGAFPTANRPDSMHRRLLPFLGHAPLAEELKTRGDTANWVVPVFGCPSDPVVHVNMAAVGDSSYFQNRGTKFERQTGFYSGYRRDTAPHEISDVLSVTVALSERLVMPLGGNRPRDEEALRREPRRYLWWTENRFGRGREAEAVHDCEHHRTVIWPPVMGANMMNYFLGGGYTHLLTPNHPSCVNGPEDFEVDFSLAMMSASSLHGPGVNSLLADGSVRFVNDSIDAAVWRALGTRNGNDVVTEF